MSISEEAVMEELKTVKYPGFSRDIVSFGLIKSVECKENDVRVSISVTTTDPTVPKKIKDDIDATLSAMDGVNNCDVLIAVTKPDAPSSPENQTPQVESMQKVKHVIAVASGKGGVGKSTVSTNLACAIDKVLTAAGKPNSVGIMDCDIYGPSIPLMMGVQVRPEIEEEMIQPVENLGIRIISMGLLIDEMTPVVWRGPMIMKTIQQFATNVNWGELEVLIVDLPPGTGDAQLSLVQTIPLDGAVIVTTPQTAAVNVARRGAMMFGKVNVPLLGVVENMSYLIDENGQKHDIFGSDGGSLTAKDLKTELLGQIPLDKNVRIGSDKGIPIVTNSPDGATGQEFLKIAEAVLKQLKD